jgi:hypothetical protein
VKTSTLLLVGGAAALAVFVLWAGKARAQTRLQAAVQPPPKTNREALERKGIELGSRLANLGLDWLSKQDREPVMFGSGGGAGDIFTSGD